MFSAERRVVAVVLPQLACELARAALGADAAGGAPLAVLVDPLPVEGADAMEDDGGRTIDAVDPLAFSRGVRPGQRVSEAAALTAGLEIAHVEARSIREALERVADVALGFGPTVSIAPPDTVWIDVSGVAHLWGGEVTLLRAIEASVAVLGHRPLVAVAEGPRIAQVLARYADRPRAARFASAGRGAEALSRLPARAVVDALAPGEALGSGSAVSLLDRLGVRTVAELVRLPAGALAARLGDRAQEILSLARGVDTSPLTPHVPPARIVEEQSLEEGVELAEALVFVARGLVSRASARLTARGEAAGHVELAIAYDRSIAELRARAAADRAAGERARASPRGDVTEGAVANDVGFAPAGPDDAPREAPRGLSLAIELPAPLAHETDLFRAVKAKLEGLVLAAPAVAVRLVLSRVGPAPAVQLGMADRSRGARAADPDALPALLSELSAEIGPERVGVLALRDDHRPEARATLEPPRLAGDAGDPARAGIRAARARAREERAARASFGARAVDFELARLPSPLRLQPSPVPLSGPGLTGPIAHLATGETVTIGERTFVVARVSFDRRIDGARWWTEAAASRDYLRVWLRAAAPPGALAPAPSICAEAWVFVDRRTGQAFVQGLWE